MREETGRSRAAAQRREYSEAPPYRRSGTADRHSGYSRQPSPRRGTRRPDTERPAPRRRAAETVETGYTGQVRTESAENNSGSALTVRIGKKNVKVAKIALTAAAALLVLVVAMVLKGVTDRKAYNNYMETAEECCGAGDYDGALAALRKAAAVDKTDECMMYMAGCYEVQGKYDKALEVLRSMDVKDPAVQERIRAIEGVRQSLKDAEKVTVAGRQIRSDSTSLVMDDMGLDSSALTEIAQLPLVERLSLAGNRITDVSALSGMGGLSTLNLSNNSVSDLWALTTLTGLKTLYLDNNPVTNLEPLCHITSLTNLSIKGIPITGGQLETLSRALPNCAIHSDETEKELQSISLGGTTFSSEVTELDLSGMGIYDISALSGCRNLTRLDLSGNNITDLSPLMNLPALKWLNVSDNALSDLRPLMGISSINYLDASGNSVTSTVSLSLMTALTDLYINSNPIRDFSGLTKLRGLKTLGLENTGLRDGDFDYLRKLSMLAELYIEDNPDITGEGVDLLRQDIPQCEIYHSELVYAVDIGGHMVFSDAVLADLSNCGLTDISGLQSLSHLEELHLKRNSISNIYILEYSDSRFTLRYLDLSDNSIEDISAVACLQSIEVLDLSNNLIGSVMPLMGLTTLRTLNLSGNNLTQGQIDELQNTLIDCEIIF